MGLGFSDFALCAMLFALSALREVGAMPAIAPIEDLRMFEKKDWGLFR